ncbi:extensin [Altererythrobacter confluentis]|uniref:Extensin n=2 Tax=Allopontixanthobacter confluentis TaxID=1849021 RepID=A0A6L7GEX4_9SPHN|nr:extensin [Allopontixanthobacter confluentis]
MKRLAALFLIALMTAGCGAVPAKRSDAPLRGPATTAIAPNPQARQCLAQLGQDGSRFTALPDKYYGAGCSQLNTVNLNALQGDGAQFSLTNIGPVTCPTASILAGWARYGVDRAARQLLGSPLQRIETMGSYACRNVAGSGRRSAHASAQAIDVAAFILADGRRISVLDGWTGGSDAEREFLRTVHASACKRFGTVLGPAYNAAHRNHLHLEEGGNSFCR